MNEVRYWLFNLDYKNNKKDRVWKYCKRNNCFTMQYQDDVQEEKAIIQNLDRAREVKIGDYCVAYTGRKTIVGVGQVTEEFYVEEDMSKKVLDSAPNLQRLGVKWDVALEKEVEFANFEKALGVKNKKELSSMSIVEIDAAGYKFAKGMCEKVLRLGGR